MDHPRRDFLLRMLEKGKNTNQTDATTEEPDTDGPQNNILSTSRQENAHQTKAGPSRETCAMVPQRPGTRSKGQEYEWEILLYIAAHLSQNPKIKDFQILFNADDLGAWDDVVARISFAEDKNDIVLFVQSKHLESKDKVLWLHLTSCNKKHRTPQKKYEINLTLYKQDFENLFKKVNQRKDAINIYMCTFLADIDSVQDYFACIFTNSNVAFCSECMKCSLESKIFDEDHPLYFLAKGNYQQFDFEKITEEDKRHFYKQLFIFSNQPNHKCLSIVDQLGPDFEPVLINLEQRIQEFMQKTNAKGELICQILNKQEFEIKCLEVVLIQNYWLLHDFSKNPTYQIQDKFKELWRKILSQKNIINLMDEGIKSLLTDYYQYSITDNTTRVNNLLFLLWREEKVPLPIKPEYTTKFFQHLKRFKNLQKRFIVFCNEDFLELQEYKLTESVITYLNEIPDIQQIISEILKVEVSLQGRELVPLSEILEKCAAGDEIFNKLSISQLLTWTMNIKHEQNGNIEKSHRIGHELPRPDNNYMRRTLKRAEKDNTVTSVSEEDVLKLATGGVNIIIGDPGMGKSTVLQKLAHSYSPKNFIIYVKFRDCLHDIEDEDKWPIIEADPIQYLFDKMADNADDIIAKSVMEIHKADNRLGIFLDAFDEVLPLHGDRITSLMERILRHTNVRIFCTTRPHAKEMITKITYAKCFELSPLTEEQIEKYLTREKYDDTKWQFDHDFLSNPLHLDMITKIYGKENRGKITEVKMYRLFIESKLDIFNYRKKITKNDAYVSNKNIINHLRILAMTDIFGLECVISKEVTSRGDLAKILDEIRNQNIGIVEISEASGAFQFVHQTFAEYLVVEWLLCKEDQDFTHRKYLKYFLEKIHEDIRYYGNISSLLMSHNMYLWYTTRKYLLINCVNEDLLSFLYDIDSPLNVKGPTLIDAVNNHYPASKPLTRDHGDSCTKLLISIHAEYKPHVEFVLKSNPTMLETGLGIVAFNMAITTGNENIVTLLLKNRLTLVDEQDDNGNTGLHIACGCGHSPIAELLLKNGANININNKQGMTTLGMANAYERWGIWNIKDIYNNKSVANRPSSNDVSEALLRASVAFQWDVVKCLLQHGADHNISDADGWTIMHFAAKRGEPEVIEILLAKGLDLNIRTNAGDTPLAIACKDWNPTMVKCLVGHDAGPEVLNEDGWSVIHFAAAKGDPEVIEILLAKGFDVNTRTKEGDTPLGIVCKKWNPTMVKFFVGHDADPKVSEKDGWTVMHFAAQREDLLIIEMLWAKGFDLNVRTNSGDTPLVTACKKWKFDMVKWLLAHGADPDVSDNDGWSVIHFAAHLGQLQIFEMLSTGELDVNLRTKRGFTPLLIASLQKNSDIVEWLLEHGSDSTASNDYGWTAMHYAAVGGDRHTQIIKMLSTTGIDPNVRNEDGKTPIFIAVIHWNLDTLELLLDHGADPKVPNADGWTVINFAVKEINQKIIEMLAERGHNVNQ